MEWLTLALFVTVILLLLLGYPVAFTLGGSAILFAVVAYKLGYIYDLRFLQTIPNRIFGIIGISEQKTLIAVPLFVFMGVMLEKGKIAEKLLESIGLLFGSMRGGIGFAVVLVGMLLAASTGIVGATVITMGLLALPTMLKHHYSPALSCGVICASGTLGQIIPPSIILVILGDTLSNAYQEASNKPGVFLEGNISVGDLFLGALIPGLILVSLYIIYLIITIIFNPKAMPALPKPNPEESKHLLQKTLFAMLPPLLLIFSVLGSIIAGIATPTEAAAVGATGAIILTFIQKQFNLKILQQTMQQTLEITSMVFLIFVGASIFSLVFREIGGDQVVENFLYGLPGGAIGALIVVMVLMFILGFFLDFIEIVSVVVPIVAPILFLMGIDPIWLGVMIALNLQTSFLTPPFGFALFYLRGVAPAQVSTMQIYQGVMPFIILQLIGLLLVAAWPKLAVWLPHLLYK